MDALQERLARAGLHVIGRRGFVLGGGHAIELHGMGTRPSEDIDLLTPQRGSPDAVADDLIRAYASDGLTVEVQLRTADLVQMEVTDPHGQRCKVDLGVFWQSRAPVLLDIGPVLHPDDAVAGKMDALFDRWAPRDFLDVHAIIASGRYTRPSNSPSPRSSAKVQASQVAATPAALTGDLTAARHLARPASTHFRPERPSGRSPATARATGWTATDSPAITALTGG
jgi:hypothetical protein